MVTAGESNSLVQLVGSTPQQAGRLTTVEEMADARPATHAGTAHPHGQPLKSQGTIVGREGSPPSSPDRGVLDSDGYSWLIFKLTDPGVEVTYTLWCFDVDAFLEQYDKASMHPYIFASLRGYLGKLTHTMDEGKDISVQGLLMHMEKMFGNKCNYDAMIRTLYEVQQKEDKTVEEYVLCIHNAVAVIHHVYPEHLPDHGRDLKKDHFYHGLCPYLHNALRFVMV